MDERPWVFTLAAGISAFVVAAELNVAQTTTGGNAGVRVANAAANLCVVPLFLCAMLAALRGHLRKVARIVVLDGVTGALAATTVALGVLGPLLDRTWDGTSAAAVALIYAAGDVVLVAAALGALGLVGLRDGRHFALWALGMVVFAASDIKYAYVSVEVGHYETGTSLDASWAIGCSLMALGAVSLRAPQCRRVPGAGSLAVVAGSALLGVAVLAVAPLTGRNAAAAVLAIVTLLCCGWRFMLAFHQLRDLTAVRVLALTDELTGVANRRALYAELDRRFDILSQANPGTGAFALLLVDLDHFKEVNDSFGHAAGDELLRAVVGRFSEVVAALDSPHLISRLGGDEFAVLLGGADGSEEQAARACASALASSLAEPVMLREPMLQLHVRGSIGVALAPVQAQSRGDLLFAADAALYAAKSSKDGVRVFSPALVGDRRQRLTLVEDLYLALERDQLVVEYQPIVATGKGRGGLIEIAEPRAGVSGTTGMAGMAGIAGVEALVRWNHPTRGRISPDDFLPAAERHRLTSLIAERVLDIALADLARWHATGFRVGVSVNVSASDLSDDRLAGTIRGALLKHGVPPSSLTIEITETAMMRDPEATQAVMVKIAAMGVRLSVDDYGTGYSSLEYLLRLPIQEIKLDRAFVRDLGTARSVAIVRSTIDLTHALGLHMVAEGVEDESTLDVLCELGCDLVQGWHLGRPAPVVAFESRFGLSQYLSHGSATTI